MARRKGGYDVSTTIVYSRTGEMKGKDLEPLTCPRCNKLLREPVQITTCGHRFCKGCLRSSTGSDQKCPIDGEEFNPTEVRNDKGCQKEIQGLMVDCPTQPVPCSWKGSLVEMEEHQDQCPNAEVVCECGGRFLRYRRDSHGKKCPKRPSNCQYCGQFVPLDSLKDHYLSCEDHPTKCDFCETQLASRKQLTHHLDEECNEYLMSCPLQEPFNCDYKEKRPQMVQHVQNKHILQVFDKLSEVCTSNQQLLEKVTRLESDNQQLHEEVSSLKSEKQRLEERLHDVEHFVKYGKELPDAVETDGVLKDYKGSRGEARAMDETERVTLRGAPRALNCWDDVERDHVKRKSKTVDSIKLGKIEEEVEGHQFQIVQISDNVQSLQESLTRQAIAIDEMRLRQDVLDVKTTNGVFVWKIPDIRRRYREAIERKTISLYSPPFFTSPNGYRMCIRAYLNGDGIGKGTHISIFFVLMRSEHDVLLNWPFQQSVRFSLVNQTNPKNSITEAFIPDLQSPSFQRPHGEMNIASGFPKFARQSVLQDENFTKENVIFIKAQVDLTGLNNK